MNLAQQMLATANAIQDRQKRERLARAESLYNDVVKLICERASHGAVSTMVNFELPEGTVLLLRSDGFRVVQHATCYFEIFWS